MTSSLLIPDAFDLPAEVDLAAVFSAALRSMSVKDAVPEVHARFYPYAGLSSTIRLRKGRIFARVSDILSDSPEPVLYALACILVAKLYRRKAPSQHERTYRDYATQSRVVAASETARRHRGYKVISTAKGKAYDLEPVFDELNSKYFQGSLNRPTLSWSPGRTRRILGHHDHVHDTIIVSRTLDSPEIPRMVLEYVMYHEMLHVKHPPRTSGNRTIYHGAEFKRDERKFEHFEPALKWLDRIALPARRRRRRRTPRPRR
ncbi:MAG TPA: M48 family peptidase [Blastocatellia bacterium]|nr:M48 family peptidase [Blastocatellia bacterium]